MNGTYCVPFVVFTSHKKRHTFIQVSTLNANCVMRSEPSLSAISSGHSFMEKTIRVENSHNNPDEIAHLSSMRKFCRKNDFLSSQKGWENWRWANLLILRFCVYLVNMNVYRFFTRLATSCDGKVKQRICLGTLSAATKKLFAPKCRQFTGCNVSPLLQNLISWTQSRMQQLIFRVCNVRIPKCPLLIQLIYKIPFLLFRARISCLHSRIF